jgi:LPS-assembly lipoprotein
LPAATVAAACGLLASCGFQLQDGRSLPPALEHTYVVTQEPYSAFSSSLTDTLRARGAEVVEAENAASSVLRIVEDFTGQRVLSVTARNVPREYEVFYQVTFSLLVGGEQMIEPESLVATRSYTYDETEVLAKAREEEVVRRALAEDLARRVVRRLEVAGGAAAAPGT